MRKSPGRPRTPASLPAPLNQRLNLYVVAATGASVSLLALTQPSEAKIVYTKIHKVIGTNGVDPLDLNHDGIIDFLIQERGSSHFSFSGSNGLWAKAAFGNGVEGSHTQSGFFVLASALQKGAPIGPRQSFVSSTGSFGEAMFRVACSVDQGCSRQGQWANVSNRYLGLKFQVDGKTHFGWARLSVQLQSQQITATLTGYAYETIPDKGIRAGQTRGTADGVAPSPDLIGTDSPDLTGAAIEPMQAPTQPASLGRLALGAGGVSLGRRP